MKVIQRENIRVEVEPAGFGYSWPNAEERKVNDCKEIVKQINRHVDNIGQVQVAWDTITLCSHCGLTWEEWTEKDALLDPEAVDAVGQPVCCEAAVEEWRGSQ